MCFVSYSSEESGDYIDINDGQAYPNGDTMFYGCGHGINGNVASYYQGKSNEMYIR